MLVVKNHHDGTNKLQSILDLMHFSVGISFVKGRYFRMLDLAFYPGFCYTRSRFSQYQLSSILKYRPGWFLIFKTSISEDHWFGNVWKVFLAPWGSIFSKAWSWIRSWINPHVILDPNLDRAFENTDSEAGPLARPSSPKPQSARRSVKLKTSDGWKKWSIISLQLLQDSYSLRAWNYDYTYHKASS